MNLILDWLEFRNYSLVVQCELIQKVNVGVYLLYIRYCIAFFMTSCK